MSLSACFDWCPELATDSTPIITSSLTIFSLPAGSPSTVAQVLLLRNNPELLRFDDTPTVAQMEWLEEMECYNIRPRREYTRRTPMVRGIRVPIVMPERNVQAGPEQIAPQLLRSDEEVDRLADLSEWLEREFGMEMGWLALLRYYVDLSNGEITTEDQENIVFSYTPTAQGQDFADRQLESLLLSGAVSPGQEDRAQTIGLAACGSTFRILVHTHSKGTIRPAVRPWGMDNHPFDLREPESVKHLWDTLMQLPRMSLGRRVPKEIGVRTHPYNPYNVLPTYVPPPQSPGGSEKMFRSDSMDSTSSEASQYCTISSWSTSAPSFPQLDIALISASATFTATPSSPSAATVELIRVVGQTAGSKIATRGSKLSRGDRSSLETIPEEMTCQLQAADRAVVDEGVFDME